MTTLDKCLGTICHTIQFVKDGITAVLSKQKFKDTFLYQIPHYVVFTSVRIYCWGMKHSPTPLHPQQ